MKNLFICSLLFFLGLPINAMALNCTDEKRARESAEYFGYDLDEAVAFGRQIQEAVKTQDIQKFSSLIDGELRNGPREVRLVEETYSEIFGGVLDSIVSEPVPCRPVGYRGFMFSNGKIWYQFRESVEGGKSVWTIVSINEWIEPSQEKAVPTGWEVEGAMIHPNCFFVEWSSSDNYEELIEGTDCSIREIGQCLEKEGGASLYKQVYGETFAVDPTACTDRQTEAVDEGNSTRVAHASGGFTSYRVEKILPVELCNQFAPHITYPCKDIRLVEVVENGGGSYTWSHANIYALFSDTDKEIFVPLANFDTVNVALNHIDNLTTSEMVWCLTIKEMSWVTKSSCMQYWGKDLYLGKSFSNKLAAQEEIDRLRVASAAKQELQSLISTLKRGGERKECRSCNLHGADFSGGNLSGIDLTMGNLSKANLTRVRLIDTNLTGADLSFANLLNANLNGANLSGANLSEADLDGATLLGTNLLNANLNGANLSGANLSEADLDGATLLGTNLLNANLTGANLSGADLSLADLTAANLYRANLQSANLREANLTCASLREVDLKDATLLGADLMACDTEIQRAKDYQTELLQWYDAKIGQLLCDDCNDQREREKLALLEGEYRDVLAQSGYLIRMLLERKKVWSLLGGDFRGTIFCNTTMPDGTINNSGC